MGVLCENILKKLNFYRKNMGFIYKNMKIGV
jgi:hypothetical protein